MGVAVKDDRVVEVANTIGCGTIKAPFSYLGSKVGGCMTRIESWKEVVDKVASRLSKWKMKTVEAT